MRFGSAYEGPPGCVHGGYIAGAFDELLGATQSLSGNPGMTGRLTVHYRSPTPLHTDLRMHGELEKVEGRKIFTHGSLFAPETDGGERLCAEAEGLFISIDFGRFARPQGAPRDARSAPAWAAAEVSLPDVADSPDLVDLALGPSPSCRPWRRALVLVRACPSPWPAAAGQEPRLDEVPLGVRRAPCRPEMSADSTRPPTSGTRTLRSPSRRRDERPRPRSRNV